jgi:hypothetical protein
MLSLYWHVKDMIKSSGPEGFHERRTNVPDCELPADAVHPIFEADELAQGCTGDKLNIAQIEDQMNTGFERNRVEKVLYRVSRK